MAGPNILVSLLCVSTVFSTQNFGKPEAIFFVLKHRKEDVLGPALPTFAQQAVQLEDEHYPASSEPDVELMSQLSIAFSLP